MPEKIFYLQNKDRVKIETFSALWDAQTERIILFDGITKGFYSLNYETGMLHAMDFLYGEKEAWAHFGAPIKLRNGGYCFPPCNRGSMVILYRGKDIEEIPIEFEKEKEWRISNALEYEDRIILLCGRANGIISINKLEKKESLFGEWSKEFQVRVGRETDNLSKNKYGNYLLQDDILIVPLLWVQSLLKLNLQTGEYIFENIDVKNTCGFLAIYTINGCRQLLSRQNNQIIEIDLKGNISIYHCELSGDTFGRSVAIGKKILILGMHTYQIVIFDMVAKRSQVYEIMLTNAVNENKTAGEANFYVLLTVSQSCMIAFDVSTRNIFKIKTDDEWSSISIEIMTLYWDEETREKQILCVHNPIAEDKNCELHHFINAIQKI